jgi:hypothetical protein
MPRLRLPLIPQQAFVGYPPDPGKTAKQVAYFSIDALMTRAWTRDAHTAAYSVEALPYRLKQPAITFDGGVAMVAFLADVDCEQSHAASGGQGDCPASDDWWVQELSKLDMLLKAFPDAFIYRTRGGYRFIYALPTPSVLKTTEDVQRWTDTYVAWIAALRQRFHIYADAACKDWPRLYRLPHATRTPNGRPEALETRGSPYQIGLWTCEPTIEECNFAKTLTKKPLTPRQHIEDRASFGSAGDGILFCAFQSRGWIGKEVAPGKWAAQCPWQDQHSKGAPFNTSTILYAPGPGDTLGWLHCSHAHCQTRDIREVLKVFSKDELARAQQAAGLITIQKSHRSPGAPRARRFPAMHAPSYRRYISSVGGR